MSGTLHFKLSVQIPDEIDAMTWAEIEGDAEPHDDTPAKMIARWLGGEIEAAEEYLSSLLPEGWHAKIRDDNEAHALTAACVRGGVIARRALAELAGENE